MSAGCAAPVGNFLTGVWSWIARGLATSIVAAQENHRRRPGPGAGREELSGPGQPVPDGGDRHLDLRRTGLTGRSFSDHY